MRSTVRLLVMCLTVLLTRTAHADTMMLIRTTETPGGADMTRTVWIGSEGIRQDAPGQSMIVDLAGDRVVLLEHETRTYRIFDLPLELDDLVSPDEAAAIRAESDSLAMTVEIRPTEERREIRSLPCRKFDVVMRHPQGMEVDAELWTTEGIDLDVSAYKTMERELAAVQTGGADWLQQLIEIEGFPVLREMVFRLPSGRRAVQREELISFEKREAPVGIYAPPSDYEFRTGSADGGIETP